MLLSREMIIEKVSDYSNRDMKLSRLVKEGKLFKIKNGLYETNPNVSNYLIANSIYGPSYISFEYALAYYEVIPERVSTVTSATFDKKKKKIYTNYFGNFSYRDVPKSVYPIGVTLKKEGEYFFQIATLEKAICDKLYTLSPIKTVKKLKYILFEDLRFDESVLLQCNLELLNVIQKHYKSTNVSLVYNYLKKMKGEMK